MLMIDRREIEALLYKETRLLDEEQLEQWLSLFTDDAVYWLPIGSGESDPSARVSIIYDDRQRMELRVERLRGGYAFAQDPPSKVCRMVGNIELGEPEGDEVTVRSVLILVEARKGKQIVYAARCRYRLRRDGDKGWKIARKEVVLVNNDQVIDNLTFLV